VAGPAGGDQVATLEELLLRMWRIRMFELRAMELFEEKLIRGSVHPYIGMEAIAVGACAAGGCTKAAAGSASAIQLLQIERPATQTAGILEEVA